MGERKVFEALTKYNRKVHVEQGDTVIQGRFGQSLHFGSDVNYVKPYMKLTVGQHQGKASIEAKEAIPGFPHLSEINLDEASIWMTTNQHLPLKTAAPSNMKSQYLGGKFHSLIALNSLPSYHLGHSFELANLRTMLVVIVSCSLKPLRSQSKLYSSEGW